MRLITSLTAAFVVAVAVAAPALAPAQSAAPKWTVDKAASKIGFRSSFSGQAFEGVFKTWDAQIAFDPRNLPASKVKVTIQMASASSGDTDRDETLPSAPWFAVRANPTAVFESTSLKAVSGANYTATGNLTLKGITKPVTFPFTLTIQNNVARMSGTATIQRNAFNVGTGQFAGADAIPFAVQVPITVVARR